MVPVRIHLSSGVGCMYRNPGQIAEKKLKKPVLRLYTVYKT
jgi:hypothetical protein